MRKCSVVLFMIIALLLGVVTAGCGKTSESTAGGDLSPQEILTGTIAGSGGITELTGDFEIKVSLDADTSEMMEEMAVLFEDPIVVSGTFASTPEPIAADITASLSMAGETMDIGFKSTDGQAWISMLDQWYEAPPEMVQATDPSQQEIKPEEIQALLTELGIDPVTWFKELHLVGEETLDGTDVYHLTGSPDAIVMITDILELLQSEKFMSLVDSSGTATDSMLMGEILPDPEDLQGMQEEIADMQAEIAEALQDFTLDLWVGVSDSLLRKATASLTLVPPADEETGGLNGVSVNVSFSLDPSGPVTVEPPASALPFEALEEALEENPELFMGPFMGLMGGW